MKVSVITLTKNRAELLKAALLSVGRQSFKDVEIIIVDDGSKDNTSEVLSKFKLQIPNIKIFNHQESIGITKSRQEALERAGGEYVAFLDDDDEWVDERKVEKQARYLDENQNCVIVGGGIEVNDKNDKIRRVTRLRPGTDKAIRKWMLLKNPFFTSTVMFRREAALRAGGFVFDGTDLAEDYDLWLRMGTLGSMHNFQEVFTAYRLPGYNKDKFKKFFKKQLELISKHKKDYPWHWLGAVILKIRLML